MVTLEFHSTQRSGSDTKLQVRANTFGEIFIQIEMDGIPAAFICLDKETAIKLAKELRKQISFIEPF